MGWGNDIDSWIKCVGNIEHAIATGIFFSGQNSSNTMAVFLDWVEGMKFDKEGYEGWLKATKGDKTAVEKVMNHGAPWTVFSTMHQFIQISKKSTWHDSQQEFNGV